MLLRFVRGSITANHDLFSVFCWGVELENNRLIEKHIEWLSNAKGCELSFG